MFSGNFLGVSLRVLAAGTLALLFSACAGTVKLPDEPRKFKVGEEVPERFAFFRSDEEIRGRLLSGTWKSREVKSISYSESASSWQNFRRSRKNSSLTRETRTFVFLEDGHFTERVETVASSGSRTAKDFSGLWIVKNGSLGLHVQRAETLLPEWEYYSLRFRDGKTIEVIEDDFGWLAERYAAAGKEIAAKNNFRYTRQDVKFFRDQNGNRYHTEKSESEWQANGVGRVRMKVRFTGKESPFILERQ